MKALLTILVFTLLAITTQASEATMSLDEQVDVVKEEIDVRQLAKAILCAEDEKRCSSEHEDYAEQIRVLRAAIKSGNYKSKDIDRMNSAIASYESRKQAAQARRDEFLKSVDKFRELQKRNKEIQDRFNKYRPN